MQSDKKDMQRKSKEVYTLIFKISDTVKKPIKTLQVEKNIMPILPR